MTGGDIFNTISNNEEYAKLYKEDELFSKTIDSLIESADDSSEKLCEVICNMAYSFETIYSLLITMIATSSDQNLINNTNELLSNIIGGMDDDEDS